MGSSVDILIFRELPTGQPHANVRMRGVSDMNLEKFTSHKGAQIKLEFEVEGYREKLLLEGYTQDSLQKKLRALIDEEGTDTGTGTIVYVLINAQGTAKSMKAADYTEWQVREEKDWFRPSFDKLDDVLLLALLTELLNDRGGMMVIEVHMGGDADTSEDEFVGPTDEEMAEINSNPEIRDRIMELQISHGCERCDHCLAPTRLCPLRHASFDMKDIMKAI